MIHFTRLDLPPLPEIQETTINDKRHYILPDGTVVPSVTTVLSSMDKPYLDKWKQKVGEEEAEQIKNKAADRGHRLHECLDMSLKNIDFTTAFDSHDLVQMLFDLESILKKSVNNIHYNEQTLFSKKFGLAGRCDLIAEYDGKLSVIDFKQSNKPKREDWITGYFLQATAYAGLYEDMTKQRIDQIVILVAVENQPPQIFIQDPKQWIKQLVAVIKDYKKKVAKEMILKLSKDLEKYTNLLFRDLTYGSNYIDLDKYKSIEYKYS